MIAVNVETIALDRIVVLPVRCGLFRKDVTASRKASLRATCLRREVTSVASLSANDTIWWTNINDAARIERSAISSFAPAGDPSDVPDMIAISLSRSSLESSVVLQISSSGKHVSKEFNRSNIIRFRKTTPAKTWLASFLLRKSLSDAPWPAALDTWISCRTFKACLSKRLQVWVPKVQMSDDLSVTARKSVSLHASATRRLEWSRKTSPMHWSTCP